MGFFERHQFLITIFRRLLDPAVTALILLAACQTFAIPFTDDYLWMTVIAMLLVVIAFDAARVYRPWRSAPLGEEVHFIVLAWAAVCGILFTLGYVTKSSEEFSRRVLLTWVVATPLIMIAIHLGTRILLRWVRERGRNYRTAVVVGGGELGRRLIRQIRTNPWLGLRVMGYFDDRTGERTGPRPAAHWLGPIAEVVDHVRQHRPSMVYIALPMSAEERIREVVESLADSTTSIYLVPDIFTFQLMHARAHEIDGLPVISLCETPFTGPEGWAKRAEDVVLGGAILLLLSPLLLTIALGVRLFSGPGPVVFKQRRYGLDGRQIRVYKFRTMTVCEDGEHVPQARQEDARVTRFGAFLRRTSLDELPQFYNVLQGRMSIVGPRPHAVSHNEQYRRLIRGYMLRHKVRPGITGLAQVNGLRGETDTLEKMQRRVEYDLKYIESWSLFLDLKIILLTLFRLRQPTAY